MKDDEITLSILNDALEIAAYFIDKYGEAYAPYFTYIEQAITRKKEVIASRNRIQDIAKRLKTKKRFYPASDALPQEYNHSHT